VGARPATPSGVLPPGRLLEPEGNLGTRGMIATAYGGTEFGLSARSEPLTGGLCFEASGIGSGA